jgi:hypothetical protein
MAVFASFRRILGLGINRDGKRAERDELRSNERSLALLRANQ